ncbi:MAG: DPP IV N-terminal domain-containing protein [Actinomycetota bacterium]
MSARSTFSIRSWLAAVAVSAVALSACGGGADRPGDTASPFPVRITAIRDGAIAFTRDVESGIPRVFLLNRDASGGTALFAPGRAQGNPAWSPDGSMMAFDIGCGSNIAAVYVVDPYGKKRVERAIPRGVDGCGPTWSPDGKTIAFEGLRAGQQDIWTSRADGTAGRRLTDDRSLDTDPSWSPDGRHIVFASDRGDNSDLYVMDADGRHARILYAGSSDDLDPSWSPDGKWVAFSSASAAACSVADGDCTSHLWVVKADGSDAEELTSGAGHDIDPAWSPDGDRIAFASDRDGDFDIFVANVADGTIEQVTNDPGADRMPTWGNRPAGL